VFAGLYLDRVERLDIDSAKADILPFIRNPDVLDIWSKPYFVELLGKIAYSGVV
jgi:hypothetical protein